MASDKLKNRKPALRTGIGFDVHPFAAGRRCVIGGVDIPHTVGLAGHSDADVLLHAICDAMLGAVAAGDIGQHFPNTDARWKDCPSLTFVRECATIIARHGYRVVNIDSTLLAEAPKVMPHAEKMRANIAQALEIPVDCIGVKATTTEKLGFVGRHEGIAAMAVALLELAD